MTDIYFSEALCLMPARTRPALLGGGHGRRYPKEISLRRSHNKNPKEKPFESLVREIVCKYDIQELLLSVNLQLVDTDLYKNP